MISLQHVMTYRFITTGPVAKTSKGSPFGERQYWEMTSGTLVGEQITAEIVMPGGDWLLIGDDGFTRPDVKVQFLTDDQELILLHYSGLVEVNETFRNAAANNQSTEYTDHYMRMTMKFDTGAEKYKWLNHHLYIAEGKLHGKNEIEYKIYQVS